MADSPAYTFSPTAQRGEALDLTEGAPPLNTLSKVLFTSPSEDDAKPAPPAAAAAADPANTMKVVFMAQSLLLHSFIQSFIHPSIHPFIHSFIHSFMHPSIHSFIHSFFYLVLCGKQVYLRVRPLLGDEAEQGECLAVQGPREVLLTAPEDSKAAKHQQRDAEALFKFSRVFTPAATQPEFFRETTLPLVQAALDGSSSLLFTYGVTSSGKTFTVQGTPTDCGLLPRSLDVIFNSIGAAFTKEPLKPSGFNQVDRISDEDAQELLDAKRQCLDQSRKEDLSNISSFLNSTTASDGAEADADEMDVDDSGLENLLLLADRVRDATRLSIDKKAQYAVFVSYAEVYNEYIFDLLDPPPAKHKRRTTKKLATDSSGFF